MAEVRALSGPQAVGEAAGATIGAMPPACQLAASHFGKNPPRQSGTEAMLSATLYYDAINRNYSQSLANTADLPANMQATAYYLANIGKVKSIDDLLGNQKLYTYVMKAYGLSDMLYAKGLIRRVFEGGVSSSNSLANTLHDPRYKALATAFDFAANGSSTTSTAAATSDTVSKYTESALETSASAQNAGTGMALYFQRLAPTVTSAYSILGDKTLLAVVQTAFGLPASMSMLDINVQAQMIGDVLKTSDLQDPTKLQKIIERFTANYDAQNANAAPANPANALLVRTPGIGSDLLLSLATLKLGGQ